MPGADHGFTMIELLMTIVVAGILLGIAMPAFRSFVHNDRDIGQINSLVASLQYARSEAIKLASPNGITVCPSANRAGLRSPQYGLAAGMDRDRHQRRRLRPGRCLPAIANGPCPRGSNTVTPVGGAATGITFSSSGLVAWPPGTTLTIRVCDTRGAAYAREVEVNATGRVAASQKPGFAVDGVTALVCP